MKMLMLILWFKRLRRKILNGFLSNEGKFTSCSLHEAVAKVRGDGLLIISEEASLMMNVSVDQGNKGVAYRYAAYKVGELHFTGSPTWDQIVGKATLNVGFNLRICNHSDALALILKLYPFLELGQKLIIAMNPIQVRIKERMDLMIYFIKKDEAGEYHLGALSVMTNKVFYPGENLVFLLHPLNSLPS